VLISLVTKRVEFHSLRVRRGVDQFPQDPGQWLVSAPTSASRMLEDGDIQKLQCRRRIFTLEGDLTAGRRAWPSSVCKTSAVCAVVAIAWGLLVRGQPAPAQQPAPPGVLAKRGAARRNKPSPECQSAAELRFSIPLPQATIMAKPAKKNRAKKPSATSPNGVAHIRGTFNNTIVSNHDSAG